MPSPMSKVMSILTDAVAAAVANSTSMGFAPFGCIWNAAVGTTGIQPPMPPVCAKPTDLRMFVVPPAVIAVVSSFHVL